MRIEKFIVARIRLAKIQKNISIWNVWEFIFRQNDIRTYFFLFGIRLVTPVAYLDRRMTDLF